MPQFLRINYSVLKEQHHYSLQPLFLFVNDTFQTIFLKFGMDFPLILEAMNTANFILYCPQTVKLKAFFKRKSDLTLKSGCHAAVLRP